MARYRNRILLLIGSLLVSACGEFQIVRVTPTPTVPPVPTATPLPPSIVNFSVAVPANTPADARVAAQVIDDVTGGRTLVPLSPAGNNVWTGAAPAVRGEVLRYRYLRTAPSPAEELTPLNQPVPYRLFLVGEGATTAADVVAAWSDSRWTGGDQGAIVGTVRNTNTNAGVRGLIVSAGGQLTVTAEDGSYALFNVPAGIQHVTALAPDGALRTAQNAVLVPPSQIVTLDLGAPDPNAVHVTFVLTPPGGTDGAATPRLIGNLAQLGQVFHLQADGTAVVGARAPTLSPLNDGSGRLAVSVLLYEGTLVRYAYTLGDGFWNSELDSGGSKRLRQFLVPITDFTQNDAVHGWHGGNFQPVTFEVTTPATTPPNEVIALQLRTTQWLAPLPMWRTGLNTWRYVLYNPENFNGNVGYRYCRNFACGAADDEATPGASGLSRSFTPTILPQALKDLVGNWRWWSEAGTPTLILPPPGAPRANFAAGADLPEAWHPAALAVYPETVRSLQASAVNTLTILRRSVMRNTAPPLLADDPVATMPEAELRALTEVAHAAGLRVAVHPVTCRYDPYGACEYFDNWAPTAEWYGAYERHLLTQAAAAAAAGADVLVIGDYTLQPTLPGQPGALPDADARWRTLITRVRERFKGQLAFELLLGGDLWPAPPAFLDMVDIVRVHWWAALAGNNATALPELTAAAGGVLDGRVKPLFDRFGKPIHLSVAYYAADGASTQCLPRPEGGCYLFSDFNPEAPDVPRYGLDLAEQADAYHAVLNAAYVRDWVSGVSTYGYNPLGALRDKSLSVRGKPAEIVLLAWFLRFQGR